MRLHHYFNQLGLFHLVKSLSTLKTLYPANGKRDNNFSVSFLVIQDCGWQTMKMRIYFVSKGDKISLFGIFVSCVCCHSWPIDISIENFLKQVFQWKSSLELYNWKHADQKMSQQKQLTIIIDYSWHVISKEIEENIGNS